MRLMHCVLKSPLKLTQWKTILNGNILNGIGRPIGIACCHSESSSHSPRYR